MKFSAILGRRTKLVVVAHGLLHNIELEDKTFTNNCISPFLPNPSYSTSTLPLFYSRRIQNVYKRTLGFRFEWKIRGNFVKLEITMIKFGGFNRPFFFLLSFYKKRLVFKALRLSPFCICDLKITFFFLASLSPLYSILLDFHQLYFNAYQKEKKTKGEKILALITKYIRCESTILVISSLKLWSNFLFQWSNISLSILLKRLAKKYVHETLV